MKPEAGQWWFPNSVKPGQSAEYRGVYIVGAATDGHVVYQSQSDGHFDVDETDFDGWHHEPRCTGWDWVVPEPQPAEDPDEWVIQDRVPVRIGIDFIRWSDWEVGRWETATGYWLSGTQYGSTQCNAVLSVRCRRRDLPKVEQKTLQPGQWFRNKADHSDCVEFMVMSGHETPVPLVADIHGYSHAIPDLCERYEACDPPQPQKTRVRLWKNNYGSVMSNDDCERLGWQEIHHDSEGFYVENQP